MISSILGPLPASGCPANVFSTFQIILTPFEPQPQSVAFQLIGGPTHRPGPDTPAGEPSRHRAPIARACSGTNFSIATSCRVLRSVPPTITGCTAKAKVRRQSPRQQTYPRPGAATAQDPRVDAQVQPHGDDNFCGVGGLHFKVWGGYVVIRGEDRLYGFFE